MRGQRHKESPANTDGDDAPLDYGSKYDEGGVEAGGAEAAAREGR
jgi:hypothetical protein